MTTLPLITDFSSAAIVSQRSLTGWGTFRFAGLLPGSAITGSRQGCDRAGNPFARIPCGELVRLNPNFLTALLPPSYPAARRDLTGAIARRMLSLAGISRCDVRTAQRAVPTLERSSASL